MSLIKLIVERGVDAVNALPDGIRKDADAVAEAIENNVRRLIIDEQPINPKYYEKMSELLDDLITQRRTQALEYQEYLRQIVELTRKAANPEMGEAYPGTMNAPARRALYDNLGRDEPLALAVDAAVRRSRQDGWRSNPVKVRMVKHAIRAALERHAAPPSAALGGAHPTAVREGAPGYPASSAEPMDARVERVLALVKNQDEY